MTISLHKTLVTVRYSYISGPPLQSRSLPRSRYRLAGMRSLIRHVAFLPSTGLPFTSVSTSVHRQPSRGQSSHPNVLPSDGVGARGSGRRRRARGGHQPDINEAVTSTRRLQGRPLDIKRRRGRGHASSSTASHAADPPRPRRRRRATELKLQGVKRKI